MEVREQLVARLADLEAEIAVGERRWNEVEQEQLRLRETLLRMSGAIQVLREILGSPGDPAKPGDARDDLALDSSGLNGQIVTADR
jgi:hypothetical protein